MIPVALNSPQSMVRMRLITLKDHADKALKALHRAGVLHVEQGEELKAVDREALEKNRRDVEGMLGVVDEVLGYVTVKKEVSPAEDVEVIYTRPFAEVGSEVDELKQRFGELAARAAKLAADMEETARQARYLAALPGVGEMKFEDLDFRGEYLFSRVFILSAEAYQSLGDRLSGRLFSSAQGESEGEAVFHGVGKASDLEEIERLVTSAGGGALALPRGDGTVGAFIAESEAEIDRLGEKRGDLLKKLEGKVAEELPRLALIRGALTAEMEKLDVLVKAGEAEYVTLIEGWVPENSAETTVAALKRDIDSIFIDTREPESIEEPPTKMANPKPLKPFEVIVGLFGVPRYREWDPTPIIAYSFAAFFGLMLADVAYAVGLIMLGKYLVPRFFGSASPAVRMLQKVIYICGAVGITLGVMSGTYLGDIHAFFGFESPALVSVVQLVLQDPLLFIMISLVIGFIHVNISHLIALIKAVRDRNRGATINKVGLFLLELGIPFLMRTMLNVTLPLPDQLYALSLYFIIAGLGMVVGGAIMERGGMGAILGLFDLTGLLGDVMSYARLAGVGLATYYLAVVFNMLAPLFGGLIPVKGVGGVILGGGLTIAILVMGHALNLILSALTGFIHSLRLCFVEFLFKFYEGGGRGYSPFILRKRPTLTVGARS